MSVSLYALLEGGQPELLPPPPRPSRRRYRGRHRAGANPAGIPVAALVGAR